MKAKFGSFLVWMIINVASYIIKVEGKDYKTKTQFTI
jgi:hypothetical protein